ncbi:uncharacterized protein LOC128346045 isoform X2 [Hemicordylus capensis]|uniref:uncharacterized protein LOC128346045 isoform X2 n=1 Tax=Hemicordylus capensis TaxID=884348 RepID=UPI00230355F3|nr:uncharacterized protein LOC128346045 isoform X2 [Hemicordylus capensis]
MQLVGLAPEGCRVARLELSSDGHSCSAWPLPVPCSGAAEHSPAARALPGMLPLGQLKDAFPATLHPKGQAEPGRSVTADSALGSNRPAPFRDWHHDPRRSPAHSQCHHPPRLCHENGGDPCLQEMPEPWKGQRRACWRQELRMAGEEKPGRKLLPCLPACSSQAKGAPLGNNDMSPWMGPSQSEAAFHALFKPMVSFLHSVPFSAAAAGTPGSCSFFPELGEKALAADGNQRRRARLLQGKGKQKSRSRGLPRHFGSKWQGMTLPPVPSITNLNFSRNFTFSFFELPPHQSHEHWMQRQQLICLLMKQLK